MCQRKTNSARAAVKRTAAVVNWPALLLALILPVFCPAAAGAQDTTAPADISNLAAEPFLVSSQTRLSWTAPGDDGNTGTAASYQIRYSSSLTFVTDSFETGLGDWLTGGDNGASAWIVDTSTYSAGIQSVKSVSNSANSGNSWIKRRVEGPFTLTFDWKVDSEPGSDYLKFLVDGTEVWSINGDVDWQSKSYSVASGSHTIEWRYTKDAFASQGLDTGWIDNVVYREFWNNSTLWKAARAVGGAAGYAEVEVATGAPTYRFIPNTTYYFGIKTRDEVPNWSGMSSMVSTVTYAAVPSSATGALFTPLYASSMTVNWSSGSVANGGYNPAGTFYNLELSTSGADYIPLVQSTRTADLSAMLTGFEPNTTYYARVNAENSNGRSTAYAVIGPTRTLAAVPGYPAAEIFADVFVSSLTVNWSSGTAANGYNPAGTLFEAQLSSSSVFSPVFVTSKTYNLSAALGGLSPDTLYYARARAMNANGNWSGFQELTSTRTMAAMPDAPLADPVYKPVYNSSMTVYWSSGSVANGGYNPSGTLYTVDVAISSITFSPLAGYAQTTNVYAAFTGLTPNTTYYSRVRAQNSAGTLTDYKVLGSTVTLAVVPALPGGAPVYSVYATSATVEWATGSAENGGFNPTGTLYKAEASVSSTTFTPLTASSQTANNRAVFIGSLTPDTSHYFRVQALNRLGTPTAFFFLGNATTLAVKPALPTDTAAFTVVFPSSMTVNWSSGSVANGGWNPVGALYRAEISTRSDFGAIWDSSQTYNRSAGFTGLTPNTTYYGRVRAEGRSGHDTDYATLGSTQAPAAVPGQPSGELFSPIYSSSVTVNWSSGTAAGGWNPAGTLYKLELSTSSLDFIPAQSSQTYNLSAELSGLTANTEYFARVRAMDSANRYTAYLVLGSSTTLALQPGPPAGDALTPVYISSMTVNWSSGTVVDGWNSEGTLYNAELSTSPAFIPVASSSQTYNLNAGFESLGPNTTYYARVQTLNGAGGGTGFLQLGSTATLAAMPALPPGLGFFPVYASSAAVNWSSGSVAGGGFNSADTLYDVGISTSLDFYPLTTVSGVSGTSVTLTGLAPGTTYHAIVGAVNFGGVYTDFILVGTTQTLPAAPGPPAGAVFAPVYVGSITVNWSSGTAAGGYNPASTLYTAEISTSSDFIPLKGSSQTYNLSAEFVSLSTNTAYHARVKAFNTSLVETGYAALGSTFTLALQPGPPAGPVYESVFASSMTVNWSSGTEAGGWNPADTLFNLELATSTSFSPVMFSSLTYNLSAALTDVTPNTRYYSRVQAMNGSGGGTEFLILSGSTLTLAAVPALPAGAAFAPLYASSVTLNWSSGTPAGGYNPSGTFYRVEISTSGLDFIPAAAFAQTADISAPLSGLRPNTTYFARVRAQNLALLQTEFAALGSTTTMAVPPELPAGAVYSPVYVTSMTVNWSSGTEAAGYNPSGTPYRLNVSTSADFIPSYAGETGALSLEFPALSPNTTYYARAAAVNNVGAVSAYLVFPAGATSAYPPGNYASPVAKLSGDGFQLRWTENGNPAGTKYTVQYSTASNFTGAGDGSAVFTSTYTDLAGLSGNATYYARVYAAGHNGTASQFNTAVSTLTFPGLPGAAPFGAVSSAAVTLNWTAGSNNTSGLSYLAQLSPYSDFVIVDVSSATSALSASFGLGGEGSALVPNTTYYFRVRGQGWSGSGLYADFGSTATLANAPLSLSAVTVTSWTVSLGWQANGNPEPGTDYQVWRATESQFATPTLFTSAASGLYMTGLSPSSTYYFRVRAVNKSGIYTDFSLDVSTRTRPVPPAAVTLSGAALGVSSISWSWNNAASEELYKVLNAADNSAISGNITGDTLFWNETALPPNYAASRRVGVYNASGVYVSTAVTTYTLAAAPGASEFTRVWQSSAVAQWSGNSNSTYTLYEVGYWAWGGSTTTLSVYVTSAVLTGLSQGTTVSVMVRAVNGDGIASAYDAAISTFIPPTSDVVVPGGEYTITYNEVSLDITQATFGETVTVRIQAPSSIPGASGGLSGLSSPIAVDISALGGSQQPVQPLKNITITMDYQSLNLTGVDEDALVIAYYNAARGIWVPLFSQRDKTAKKITARTDHFSLFQLMQAAAPSALSGVTVGPNPIRPLSNPGEQFVFRNLPAGTEVRIYTYLGELVYETASDATGQAAWSGRNKGGARVASDIYLALVNWRGQKKTFKLVVQK